MALNPHLPGYASQDARRAAVGLPTTLERFREIGRGSVFGLWSMFGGPSFLSIASAASLLCIGSFASILSIASRHSVLSIASDGGFLSIGRSAEEAGGA